MSVFILFFFFVIVLFWKVAMNSIIQTTNKHTCLYHSKLFLLYFYLFMGGGREVHVSHNDPMGVREKLLEDDVGPRDQTHGDVAASTSAHGASFWS